MFDFTVEEGEQLTIRCTIQNPESLVNIENGSLALTKGGSYLTRKLALYELIILYTIFFKRILFSNHISILYTTYLIASSNTQLSLTWHKATSSVDDSGVYICLYTTYPDPVSVSVYATVIAQGLMLHFCRICIKYIFITQHILYDDLICGNHTLIHLY